jgi:hypothetical protein
MRRRLTLHELFRLGLPLCGWVSLTLFVFAVSGLPIPLPLAKDLSRPFPCMFDACGCRSAEQCWRSCCCHIARERLAWAKAHQVRPPAVVVAAAKREARLQSPGGRACCQSAGENAALSLVAALRCRGAHEYVAGVPICLPPPPVAWRPMLSFVEHAHVASLPTPSWVESPPAPPPRSAHC